MGTGKTTVSRAVAQRLGFECLDSDREIEQRSGKTIADIFAGEGEPALRRLEREFVEGGHPPARVVVACGGGLVIPPGMSEALAARGVVVCLHASIETILARTARQNHRPLLNVADPEARVRSLFAEREAIYRKSGTLVLTDGRPVREIATHVIRIWHRDAAVFAQRHPS